MWELRTRRMKCEATYRTPWVTFAEKQTGPKSAVVVNGEGRTPKESIERVKKRIAGMDSQ